MKEKKITDIFVIHVTKQLDLTESPLSTNLVVESVCDFLNGNAFIAFRVHSRAATIKELHNKSYKDIKLYILKKTSINHFKIIFGSKSFFFSFYDKLK